MINHVNGLSADRNGADVVVVGGGPAGMMAAYRAAQRGLSVLILEATPRLLNKLRITGKGRCNLTNAADRETFLSNIARGERFFRSAFSAFDNHALMSQFELWGVALKIERGQRVFPEDDNASTIAQALTDAVKKAGVSIRLKSPVKSLVTNNERLCAVVTGNGQTIPCGACIVATGGLSYPKTGSTGDGYRLARQSGHTHTELLPSLAPVQVKQEWVPMVEGLSLRNVMLTVIENKKRVFEKQGEMLFTSDGLSGPLILSASAHIRKPTQCRLLIDLKPALSEEQLDKRLLRELSNNANKAYKNIFPHLFARSLCPVILMLLGDDPLIPCNQVTKAMRTKLIKLMCALPLDVRSVGPIEEAVVTRGGIPLDEINPKTMQSKYIQNLYFAGELLDIDGYTGGFNLQIAFSTGFAAGHFCEII